jgi:hypothetical protein
MAYYWELCSLDDSKEGPILMHMMYHSLIIDGMSCAEYDRRFHPSDADKREQEFIHCTIQNIERKVSSK